MTRLSKREIERRLEKLSEAKEARARATPMLVPESAIPADAQQEYDFDDVDAAVQAATVTNSETGREQIAIPWTVDITTDEGIPMTTKRYVAKTWQQLGESRCRRERELREDDDEPLPPVLTDGGVDT